MNPSDLPYRNFFLSAENSKHYPNSFPAFQLKWPANFYSLLHGKENDLFPRLRARKYITGATKLPSLDKEGKDAAVRRRQGWSDVFDWRESAAFAPPRPRLRLGHPFPQGGFNNLIRGGEL
jgi:hypothetical protein